MSNNAFSFRMSCSIVCLFVLRVHLYTVYAQTVFGWLEKVKIMIAKAVSECGSFIMACLATMKLQITGYEYN